MADVTEAVAQEAIADSLLGDPAPQDGAEQSQAGTEAVDQIEDVGEPQEVQEQEFAEENAEDWLPSDQDKIFPPEVYAKYAQRYGLSEEQASDPLIQRILHDKINSDIFLRQQQEQQEFEVPEVEQEPTQLQPQQLPTFEEHFANLNNWAQQYTDPKVATMFAGEFMKAFGVNEAMRPEAAQAFTRTFTTFGLNLIQTALPQMIAPMLDSVMPGFSGMYYQAGRANAWDSIRNSSAEFADLPAYGSKDFVELCARLDQENPGLTDYGYSLEKLGGGQLHGPNAERFYSTLARLAIRPTNQIDPQLLQQAAEAGARNARRADVRRSAGNLGAGQSKGLTRGAPKSQFQTNQDIFDEDAMAIYRREHGSL